MWRRAGNLVGAIACGAALAGCPTSQGTDLFRVAASGTPGALLSVWGDPTATRHAFLAGGYVQVDPATISDGTVGRLVEYTPGAFRTVCRTDHVLWWVTGAFDQSGTIFAVGEGGRVIRYHAGQCDTLNFDVTYPEGVPTFFGAFAPSSNELWLVGGSALPTGPRGVLVHWDGTTFRQEANLPMAAQHANLFKIDMRDANHFVVVGTQGTVIERDAVTMSWSPLTVANQPVQDNTLFTVSCRSGSCWAVGGVGAGMLVTNTDPSGLPTGAWQTLTNIGGTDLSDLPGVNGVFVQDQQNVFIVGLAGFTMHTNGSIQYRPPTAPTQATLHGVGGNRSVVLAVGGELDVTNASQRGVILVRGDSSPQFTFDGQTFMATGDLRTSLGGTGQGR